MALILLLEHVRAILKIWGPCNNSKKKYRQKTEIVNVFPKSLLENNFHKCLCLGLASCLTTLEQ